MKNLKKVLAMVLAFACTFSMFAGAKVFEDVPAGSDYSEAVTMLSDLGIIQGKDDGKYHPEDTITRAEACAMIARLMTGDPNVSQYVGAQSFTDVAKGSWKDSAIGYCYINGIVIGVGNNKFEPDRAITDAEFITMVVRAMGYETADMKQNYPFSYMSNAQAIGLLDGTNMVASTDALRGEDAQVIYNALFTDYARGAKLVNTTHGTSVETYPTLAESVWGLERAAVGTWTKDSSDDENVTLTNCKAHTWVVVGADKEKEGYILAYPIDDDTTDVYKSDVSESNGTKYVPYSFKYDGDASAIAGYQVELWGEGQHGEPTWEKGDNKFVYSEDWTIKAIKTVKGQTKYDYNASMADSKSTNGEIVLGETTLDLDSVANNASNVKMANTTETGHFTYLSDDKYNNVTLDKSDKKVEEALNVRDGAQYKLMDWDSDGDVDWVVISEANYYKVEAVNSTRVTVSSMKTGDEEKGTDSDSQTWKLNDLTELNKVKYDFKTEEDLAEGDIIEVTYSVAYNKSEKEEVVTATITKVEADTAELDKVSTKDTLELTFDGEVKKVAEANDKGDVVVPANPKTYGDFDDEELGTSFNLWMNRNGFIVYSDYANETVNYLMVLDTANGSDKTGDRKLAKMDVLFADNSVKKDVEVVSDLDLTGYDDDTRAWNESDVVGNVYKYWQDEDGTITKMEPMFSDNKYTVNGSTYSAKNYTYDESADRLKEGNKFIASLEEADVIFAVTENYIKNYKDGSVSNLKVDAGDVLAVKQSDIPEIGTGDNETAPASLVTSSGAKLDTDAYGNEVWSTTISWLKATDASYIAEVDKNGEASAAILGVENFNKFNAANTTVGLVTSVSYDKNDVVEIEVAYKGEVTTVKSAEDVDFEDIVKEFNGSKDVKLSTKDAASKLKDNARYAEITTNADGVLTAVTFMNVNVNKATGHYYEVSRRVITDVESNNVAYGDENFAYYDNKNLYSVGRLPIADTDLADEVYYYTIDGRPTTHDDKYDKVALAVANGFDGTPDIKAATDSTLVESYINNKFDDVDDYQVADLVTKIDGNIVAAYAFEDTLGEVEGKALAVPSTTKMTLDLTEDAAGKTLSWTEVGDADVDSIASSNDDVVADIALSTDATGKYVNSTTIMAKKAGTTTLKLMDGTTEVGTVEVVVEDAAIPTYESKVVSAGKEVGNTATITIKSGIKTGITNVAFDGKDVDFDTTNDAATTAQNLVEAINKTYIAYSATSAGDTVTIVSTKDDAFEVVFTGQPEMFETTYSALDDFRGVATLTITSSAKTDATLQLVVDSNKFTGTAPIKEGDSAETIANKIATACSSSTGFDVSAKGNVITVKQKDAYINARDMVLSIVKA